MGQTWVSFWSDVTDPIALTRDPRYKTRDFTLQCNCIHYNYVVIIVYTELENYVYNFKIRNSSIILMGARGSVVIKALCYKPEGRGFDSR
jgi:hypothetical protein